MGEILKAINIGKSSDYGRSVNILKDINFSVEEGEFVILCGAAESGKNIIDIIGGIDRPSCGKMFVYNDDITKFDDKQLNDYRFRCVGFVSKSSDLINNLTLKENIMLVSGNAHFADKILAEMGLLGRANAFPSELTRVEQITALFARAMAKSPILLLCDDIAFGLDENDTVLVTETIYRINRESGVTVIMTAQSEIPMADKAIKLKGGTVESIIKSAFNQKS